MRDWEAQFSQWAKPPGKSEQERCQNAENAIRNAIKASDRLKLRKIKIFTHGSYQNNTNVRKDSDVDVGILCYDVFFPNYPDGLTKEHFGHKDSDYNYSTFKDEVEQALIDYFGWNAIKRGNKAFNIKETTYHVEADAAPFFEHRRYHADGSYLSGVELRPDKPPPFRIINWPEQHYNNGVRKNNTTGKRYKSLVRILKSLRNEMDETGISAAKPISGFLVECLVWNIPNENFGHYSYSGDVRAGLIFLYNNTMSDEQCSEWGEVSELKYLFRSSQNGTRIEAHSFLGSAWDYLGFG